MSLELVFLICNYGVLPAWILLVFAPRWSGTERTVFQVWIPMLLAMVYGTFLFANPGTPAGGNLQSLEGVVKLFSSPHIALAGWIHYLAFDLFVGAWQVRDARRREIPHAYVIPCLILTLAFGPVGLLAYLGLRWIVWGIVDLEEGLRS